MSANVVFANAMAVKTVLVTICAFIFSCITLGGQRCCFRTLMRLQPVQARACLDFHGHTFER